MSNRELWLSRIPNASHEEEKRFGMVDELIRSLIELREQAATDRILAKTFQADYVQLLASVGGRQRHKGGRLTSPAIGDALDQGAIKLSGTCNGYELTRSDGVTLIRSEAELDAVIADHARAIRTASPPVTATSTASEASLEDIGHLTPSALRKDDLRE